MRSYLVHCCQIFGSLIQSTGPVLKLVTTLNACVIRKLLAQKFTLRTRKAPHWLVVDSCVVHTSCARRFTI